MPPRVRATYSKTSQMFVFWAASTVKTVLSTSHAVMFSGCVPVPTAPTFLIPTHSGNGANASSGLEPAVQKPRAFYRYPPGAMSFMPQAMPSVPGIHIPLAHRYPGIADRNSLPGIPALLTTGYPTPPAAWRVSASVNDERLSVH